MSRSLRGCLAGLDRGRTSFGDETAAGVAKLGDGLDERHRAAPLAFLLVDLVDAGLERQVRPGVRWGPVEDVLLAAVQQAAKVDVELGERRRAGSHPEVHGGQERRRHRWGGVVDVRRIGALAGLGELPDLAPLERHRRRLVGQPDLGLVNHQGCSFSTGGPCSKSCTKPSSSRVGTPRLSALASFVPGLSPTITQLVFFDTLDVTFPPRASMAAWASSRVKCSRPPVMTKDRPTRVASSSGSATGPLGAVRSTPARRSFSTTSRLRGTAKNRATLSAMTGPTPSTAVSSATEACSTRPRSPRARATACAAAGPRCRTPRPTSTRARPRDFDVSIDATRFSADFWPMRSSGTSCSTVKE